MMTAEVGTQVPFHIYGEMHRSVACDTSRSEEVRTTRQIYSSNSQTNVIEPKPTTTRTTLKTGASPLEMDWQSASLWPPRCAGPSQDSSFPMEGRDLKSICRAAVRRIDECLAEAAEVVKSIQLSRVWSHEPMKQRLMFKPMNLYDPNGCNALKTRKILGRR